jgi:hypothetical protein
MMIGRRAGVAVSIVTKLWVGRPENLSLISDQRKCFTTVSRPALRLTPPPMQWVPEISDWGVRQATYLCVRARLGMPGGIPPVPRTSSWRGVYQLKEQLLLS